MVIGTNIWMVQYFDKSNIFFNMFFKYTFDILVIFYILWSVCIAFESQSNFMTTGEFELVQSLVRCTLC
jgi:hypothetical protein